jgi:hypothetical protein
MLNQDPLSREAYWNRGTLKAIWPDMDVFSVDTKRLHLKTPGQLAYELRVEATRKQEALVQSIIYEIQKKIVLAVDQELQAITVPADEVCHPSVRKKLQQCGYIVNPSLNKDEAIISWSYKKRASADCDHPQLSLDVSRSERDGDTYKYWKACVFCDKEIESTPRP